MSTYTYDAANRLMSIRNPQSTISHQYNGLGDRVSQTVNGVTTNYLLDLNTGLTQVLANGTNTYLYGPSTGSGGRIGELQPGGWAYHLGDALGSVRQLADAGGEQYYDPATGRFLTRANPSGPNPNVPLAQPETEPRVQCELKESNAWMPFA